MIPNEGETDRIIRSIIGVLLILIGYSVGVDYWQIAFYILGGLLLITGITGFCLIYKILGVSTNNM